MKRASNKRIGNEASVQEKKNATAGFEFVFFNMIILDMY